MSEVKSALIQEQEFNWPDIGLCCTDTLQQGCEANVVTNSKLNLCLFLASFLLGQT
jgi:hypothetical protein